MEFLSSSLVVSRIFSIKSVACGHTVWGYGCASLKAPNGTLTHLQGPRDSYTCSLEQTTRPQKEMSIFWGEILAQKKSQITNMQPENGTLEEEIPFGNWHQITIFSFYILHAPFPGGCKLQNTRWHWNIDLVTASSCNIILPSNSNSSPELNMLTDV